jgi:hypothetical protein
MGGIGGRPEAPPQPTTEQMMRGGPVKGVAVSADTLRAQRRVDDGTGGSVGAPWVLCRLERRRGRSRGVRGAWGDHAGGSWSRCCTRGYTACNIGTGCSAGG